VTHVEIKSFIASAPRRDSHNGFLRCYARMVRSSRKGRSRSKLYMNGYGINTLH
jgi:hypothetical protein